MGSQSEPQDTSQLQDELATLVSAKRQANEVLQNSTIRPPSPPPTIQSSPPAEIDHLVIEPQESQRKLSKQVQFEHRTQTRRRTGLSASIPMPSATPDADQYNGNNNSSAGKASLKTSRGVVEVPNC